MACTMSLVLEGLGRLPTNRSRRSSFARWKKHPKVEPIGARGKWPTGALCLTKTADEIIEKVQRARQALLSTPTA